MNSISFYRAATVVCYPFIYLYLKRRLKKGKEDAMRFNERLGKPVMARPEGKLVWMHGASVGECLSMLPLIKKIISENKNTYVMVTSGTVTSAKLLTQRLPERSFHPSIPIDCPRCVIPFIKHWHPDAAFWFESEFWPNILTEIKKNNIPLILLNGRVSDKSFASWKKHKSFIRPIQELFTLSFGQTEENARRLKELGAPNVDCVGNLKFSASAPVVDEEELSRLQSLIGNRPTFMMASTHDNEEEKGGKIYLELAKKYPDLLMIAVPRHPNRAQDISKALARLGLSVAQRSKAEEITPKTNVYLMDTLGEMGLAYKLSKLIFVGGSLIPFGGQNMLEPMREGACVFVGPHAFNFREIVQEACEQNALVLVKDEEDLKNKLDFYLSRPEEIPFIGEKGKEFALGQMGVLDRVYDKIKQWV